MKISKLALVIFAVFFSFGIGNFCLAVDDVDWDHYDLEVISIDLSVDSPAVNQDCVITVKVKNNGNLQLLSSKGLSSYLMTFPGFKKTSFAYTYPSLDNIVWPDEYIYYIIEGSFSEVGSIDLEFAVNYNEELGEYSYENNSITKAVTIQDWSAFDLMVDSIEIGDGEEDELLVVKDEPVDITVIIKNNSNIDLVSDKGLTSKDRRAEFSGFMVDSYSCDDYPSVATTTGSDETFECVYTGRFLEHGDRTLKYTIDLRNKWEEADEENNILEKDIYVYFNEEERDKFQILDSRVETISSTSVRVIWETNKKTTGTAWVEEKPYNLYREEKSETESYEHSKNFEDLLKKEAYYYRVVANYANNEESTESVKFTMPANDEIIFSNKSASISGNKATFGWDTNLISSGHVYYKLIDSEDYNNSGTNEDLISHEVILEDLACGTYDYYFVSENIFGKEFSTDILQFTIGEVGVVENQEEAHAEETEDQPNQTQAEKTSTATSYNVSNDKLYGSLKGKIVLTVEANGEAYYIAPGKKEMYYLGRPDDAFNVMREQGIGISNTLLEKIEIGLGSLTGPDSDGDGLTDLIEDAIGLNKLSKDSDGDGYEDKDELESGYSPVKSGESLSLDKSFANLHLGKIFLQVEAHGEAWYVNPVDSKRYFLGRPADAFSVMRNLGLGVSNSNFEKLKGGEVEQTQEEEIKEDEQGQEDETCYENNVYNYALACPDGWPLKIISDELIKIGTVPPKNGQGAITIEVGLISISSELEEVKQEASQYEGVVNITEENVTMAGVTGVEIMLENLVTKTKDHYIQLEKDGYYYLIKYSEESSSFVADVLEVLDTFGFTK